MLSDQFHGSWNDVGFTVEAGLAGDGLASVTEVRIDGREPLRTFYGAPKTSDLSKALDWGVLLAVAAITRCDDRPIAAHW